MRLSSQRTARQKVLVYAFAALSYAGPLNALTIQDAIALVLETNPEITAAEANKQAVEFELEQARNLWAPRVELEAFAGSSLNDGETTPSLSAADDWITGYEVSTRISQLIFDGYETRSEIERQAYRIDAAAYRVMERSEVLSLEAVRLYADVIRVQRLIGLARENAAYHRNILRRIQQGFDAGVVGLGDLQQAEERLILTEDILLGFELDLEDIESLFLATVGVEAKGLGPVPNIGSKVPASLESALASARTKNPTIMFSQADVGSQDAQSRRVGANSTPRVYLEADGRFGEDVSGYKGNVADARVGLVMRWDFQGGAKRAAREEQARRTSESRARLLVQTRQVEREVRQSWMTLNSAQRRARVIASQAKLARELLRTYEAEFEVGQRSLLDVLNTQNALFQTEANLVNAESLKVFLHYRILAAIGILLPSLQIQPPEDAKVYAREKIGVPPVRVTETGIRSDAATFRDWRRTNDR